MWTRSFVATTVALGGDVDAAVDALGGDATLDGPTVDLLRELRAPTRAARAVALAKAVREVALAVDETTLR